MTPRTTPDTPSFVRNLGKVSFTYRDGGLYGQYINRCRLAAWSLALERQNVQSGKVIDIGCSYGSWADNYRQLGFTELVGIEPNEAEVERARERFDRVYCAYCSEAPGLGEQAGLVAANGVVVHILEDHEEVEFLRSAKALLKPGGRLLVSVVNCAYYLTANGRQPWTGPNSCTKELNTHLDLANRAGLEVLEKVGTFINPWCLQDLDFIAGNEQLKESREHFEGWALIADSLRPVSLVPFAEVLLVLRPFEHDPR